MQEQIENLVKLQAVETGTRPPAANDKNAARADRRGQSALAAMQKQSAAASDALNREDSLRTRLDRESRAHRQKAARYKAQQDSVTTPAQAAAIEHEIQFATTQRSNGWRMRSLPAWSAPKAQEAALATARKQVEELAATLDKTREYVAGQQKRDRAAAGSACAANANSCAR